MKNKKLFAILTLVCFLFTLMPMAAMAESDGVIDTEDELQTALNDGGTVTLGGDITVTTGSTLTIAKDKNVTLDLNGHSITGTDNKTSGNYELILVDANANLTIKDSKKNWVNKSSCYK